MFQTEFFHFLSRKQRLILSCFLHILYSFTFFFQNSDLFLQTFWILSLVLLRFGHGVEVNQEYFSDVLLPCSASTLRNSSENSDIVLTEQIWLLPDGGVIQKGHAASNPANIQLFEEDGTLMLCINKIDDINFGVYWCIQVWNNTSIRAIRHTINIDGPPLHEFYEQQKKNAIVGAIAAGVVLFVVIVTYVIWYFKCSEKVKRKRRLVEDLSKGINRYSTQIYDNVGMEVYIKKTEK